MQLIHNILILPYEVRGWVDASYKFLKVLETFCNYEDQFGKLVGYETLLGKGESGGAYNTIKLGDYYILLIFQRVDIGWLVSIVKSNKKKNTITFPWWLHMM